MTASQEDAAQLDTVIDSLLRDRGHLATSPRGELAMTAQALYESLPRFHPRFSFEEHLARRLAVLRTSDPARGATPPTPIGGASIPGGGESSHAATTAAARRRRGLVAGGAIASGVSIAIPIAGAALVMWRRSRSSGGML